MKLGDAETSTTSQDVVANTDSTAQNYNYANILTTDDTFAQVGLTSEGTITVMSDGTQYVVTVEASDTVDDILTTLAGLGITGSVSNGRLTLQGDRQAYITGISENLNNTLALGATNYNTSNQTVTSNTASSVHATSTINTLTTDDTFGQLGLTADGTITVVTDGTEYVVTVNSSDTVDDIISTLAGMNISASVSNGIITLQGTDGAYIKGISDNVKTLLKLSDTNYTTSSTSRVENTQSNRQFETVTAAATGTTQLQHMKDNLGNATTGYQIILSTNSASGNNTVTIDFAATSYAICACSGFAVSSTFAFSAGIGSIAKRTRKISFTRWLIISSDTAPALTESSSACPKYCWFGISTLRPLFIAAELRNATVLPSSINQVPPKMLLELTFTLTPAGTEISMPPPIITMVSPQDTMISAALLFSMSNTCWKRRKPPPQMAMARKYMPKKMQMVMVSNSWVSVMGSRFFKVFFCFMPSPPSRPCLCGCCSTAGSALPSPRGGRPPRSG